MQTKLQNIKYLPGVFVFLVLIAIGFPNYLLALLYKDNSFMILTRMWVFGINLSILLYNPFVTSSSNSIFGFP